VSAETARDIDQAAARALLDWQLAAGVDETIAEAPVNRMDLPRPDTARPDIARPDMVAARPPGPPPDGSGRDTPTGGASGNGASAPHDADPAMAARTAARGAATLDDLHGLLQGFDGCPLKFTAKNLCFADGNPEARVMFIGEAPGAQEDIQGKPFVGRAGALLDKMLAAIGLDRDSAYITNVVYWRPPGNRTPTPQETQACRPFIDRQIELADPDIVVFLGGAAAKEMLQRSEGILRMRGKWFDFDTGARQIKAIATLHPAYLLRQPGQKRLAWRDFLAIRKALGG